MASFQLVPPQGHSHLQGLEESVISQGLLTEVSSLSVPYLVLCVPTQTGHSWVTRAVVE